MEENNFEDRENFIRDILMILDRGSTNDVNIRLSDGEMTANKVILMARSEYFATMLSNNKFVEGETTSVDMSHCSKAIMAKIVKFLFSGGIKFSDLSLAQLLELSHMSCVITPRENPRRRSVGVQKKSAKILTMEAKTVKTNKRTKSGQKWLKSTKSCDYFEPL